MTGEVLYRNVRRGHRDADDDATANPLDYVGGEQSYDGGKSWHRFSAWLPLLRIDMAMANARAFDAIWALQDGYGEAGYEPAQGYDWSGIRDSSPEAVAAMERVAKQYVPDEVLFTRLGLSQPTLVSP